MNKFIPIILLLSLSTRAQDTCQDELAPECVQLCNFLGVARQVRDLDATNPRLFGWLAGTLDANDCTMDAVCYHSAAECGFLYQGILSIIRLSCHYFTEICLMQHAQCLMDNPVTWSCY